MSWVAQCFTSGSKTSNSLHTTTNLFLGTASASSSLSKDGQATSYVPKVTRHTTLPSQPLQSLHTNKCCTLDIISCMHKNNDKTTEYLLNWFSNGILTEEPVCSQDSNQLLFKYIIRVGTHSLQLSQHYQYTG